MLNKYLSDDQMTFSDEESEAQRHSVVAQGHRIIEGKVRPGIPPVLTPLSPSGSGGKRGGRAL